MQITFISRKQYSPKLPGIFRRWEVFLKRVNVKMLPNVFYYCYYQSWLLSGTADKA